MKPFAPICVIALSAVCVSAAEPWADKRLTPPPGLELWPYLPRYNGAAEAPGSARCRPGRGGSRPGTTGPATGHATTWEAARLQANQTARPAGHDGPTPEEMWRGRTANSAGERVAFAATVARNLIEETGRRRARTPSEAVGRTETEPVATDGVENQIGDCGLSLAARRNAAQAAVRRSAIGRALVEHVLLSIRRRRIAPPIRSLKRIKIWESRVATEVGNRPVLPWFVRRRAQPGDSGGSLRLPPWVWAVAWRSTGPRLATATGSQVMGTGNFGRLALGRGYAACIWSFSVFSPAACRGWPAVHP
jgi:hypothetical protein